MIRFEDEGLVLRVWVRSRGSIDDVVKCLGGVVKRRRPVYPIDMKFIKMEREYRQKRIYGDKKDMEMKSIV